jgi:peptidoglycan/xylan/chitin deacetylase (PgdA/CDA1 family)
MKYMTFSFDDGYLVSTLKTAQIYESFGLRAEFNVTAAFAAFGLERCPGKTAGEGVYASFDILNDLQKRGHVIQPHGYNHTDKAAVKLSHNISKEPY